MSEYYLGRKVHIGIIVQKQCGCFNVILFGSYMQSWQTYFASRVVFEQDGHYFFMALLKSNREWSKAVFGRQTLIGVICQQEFNYFYMILLCGPLILKKRNNR